MSQETKKKNYADREAGWGKSGPGTIITVVTVSELSPSSA